MAEHHPEGDVVVTFHPACFMKHGHFAGDDRARADAFVEYANDPRFDAIWFARGGYGSCRIVEDVIPRLTDVARGKRYLGYSDVGTLLAGMYKAGFQASGARADGVGLGAPRCDSGTGAELAFDRRQDVSGAVAGDRPQEGRGLQPDQSSTSWSGRRWSPT